MRPAVGPVIGAVLGLGVGLAAAACRLPNPEHCTNQDQAGNDYCAGVNSATPFCSPCHEKNHGCLPFEPTACEAYTGGSDGPMGMDSSGSSG